MNKEQIAIELTKIYLGNKKGINRMDVLLSNKYFLKQLEEK